jgi:hypothetical protein
MWIRGQREEDWDTQLGAKPGRGKGADLGYFAISFGITGDDYIAQGDYDGNGRTEAAIWRQSTGTFWTIDPVTRVQSATNWGIPGDLPVASYDTH